MVPIAKYLRTHASGETATNYTPTFTDRSGHGTVGGSIGSWTPSYFAIHNPQGTSLTATVWTVEQGTAGAGSTLRINPGETVYVNIAKVQVPNSVTLLGTLNTPMVY